MRHFYVTAVTLDVSGMHAVMHAAVIHSHCRTAKAMFTSTTHCSTCDNFHCKPVEPELPESPETFSTTSCSSSHTGSLSVVLMLAFNSASQFFIFRLCNPVAVPSDSKVRIGSKWSFANPGFNEIQLLKVPHDPLFHFFLFYLGPPWSGLA